MRNNKLYFLFFLFLNIFINPVFAKNISCKVVGISDGDTISCLSSNKVLNKIRLAEIDAPEKNQEYGTASKKNLSKLIFDKNVNVTYSQKDRYGRTIGYIKYLEKDINHQQIKDGMAWFYTQYGKNQSYKQPQISAQKIGIGMWQHSQNIPPWEFRHGIKSFPKSDNLITASTVKSSGKFACVNKFCKQIKSCEEAMYLLKTCGYKKLDRDNDGKPCENVCH